MIENTIVFFKVLSSTKVFSIYNNKKCFLSNKSALEWFLKDNVTLKTGISDKICDPESQNTVLSRWGVFVAIANNTLYGSKLSIFL